MEKKLLDKRELVHFFIDEYCWFDSDMDEWEYEDDPKDTGKVCFRLAKSGMMYKEYSFVLNCERTADAIYHALRKECEDFDVNVLVWKWIEEGESDVETMVGDAREMYNELENLLDDFEAKYLR